MNPLVSRTDPAFRQELFDYLLFYSRVTCVVTIILTLGGAGLDQAFYPQYAREFGWARVTASSLIAGVLLSYQTQWGRRHIRPLTYFWLCVPQAMICWMIYFTNGEQSIYFVGLTFALSGIGFFLPLTLVEAIAFGAMSLVAYTLGCALRPSGIANWGQWAGNMTFLLFFAIICVVISVYSEKWRWMSFSLKVEIQKKNQDLHETNQAMAQIKGQMIQQEKMAALGTLSAGLMHEVNNPVNYSLMALNMAMLDPAINDNAQIKESVVDAREGMQRVQKIVSDLKTFAYQRPGDELNRIFLLEKAVQAALRLTGFELKGTKITVDLPMDTHVYGDEPGIIGVLINLLSNAALAMQTAKREHPQIDVRGEYQDNRLHLAVRDNGSGVSPADLTRVFEPFFTTRDVGQGLGLGLSVSYAIIQRHGGTLNVASEHGAWTEFSFDLQMASPSPTREPRA